MPDQVGSFGLSRRDFVRAAGISSGALALGAYAAGAPGAGGAAPGTASRVGAARNGAANPPAVLALVPALRDAAALAGDYLAGLSLALDGTARLVVEEITSRAWRSAERIGGVVAREGVAMVVGLLGMPQAIALHEQLPSRETILLVSSAGETLIREEMTHPSLFHHGLGEWQASWALGEWAAANVGRRAALAASFFDSGYDTVAAFRLGFEAAGGEVLVTNVTHLATNALPPVPLIAPLAATRPDFVFAAYSGREAAEFIRAYAASELAGRVPLLGTGFLTDAGVLGLAGDAATGIRTAAAWGATAGATDSGFAADYAALDRGEPGAFALLGHETGLLVGAALATAGAGATSAGALREALAAACVNGGRGCVAMQPGAQSTAAPVFLREVRAEGGTLRNAILAELAPIGDLDPRIAAMRGSARSGWLDNYLGL